MGFAQQIGSALVTNTQIPSLSLEVFKELAITKTGNLKGIQGKAKYCNVVRISRNAMTTLQIKN